MMTVKIKSTSPFTKVPSLRLTDVLKMGVRPEAKGQEW